MGDDLVRCVTSEQLAELGWREPSLAKDRAQCSGGQRSMDGHDCRAAVFVPQFEMAPALADLSETDTFERPRRLLSGDDGEP